MVTSCSRNIRWAKAGQGDAVHVREGEHPPEKILGSEEGPEEVEDKERWVEESDEHNQDITH